MKYQLFFLTTLLVAFYVSHLVSDELAQAPITLQNTTLTRTLQGVVKIEGNDIYDVTRGLGYAHAMDRGFQMIVLRLVGQGRLSEVLVNSRETLEVDVLSRQLGFERDSRRVVEKLGEKAKKLLEAYADGVNMYFENNGKTMEMILIGYQPEKWEISHSVMIAKLMSYFGLAQTQQDIEKWIIQVIQKTGDTGVKLLQRLYKPHLDGLNQELIELIKKVRIELPLIPDSVRYGNSIPKLLASNNWAVAGAKSVSGNPIYASDPHLEIHQLPPVWYEYVGVTKDNYYTGITVPGMPLLVMGRTKHIAYGFSYGFMDMIDYFIEECEGETCKRGDKFVPVKKTVETIKRKGSSPIEIVIYETVNGVLEIRNFTRHGMKRGFYLSRAFSNYNSDAGALVYNALADTLDAKTVPEFQKNIRKVDISTNMVVIDRQGNIGYQQSGLLPKRIHSGLYPLQGWIEKNSWSGFVHPDNLTSKLNPKEDHIETANNEWNTPGKPLAVNMHLGDYRSGRIKELLESKQKWSVEDFKKIQSDLVSIQAREYMKIIRPLLPKDPIAKILAEWDLRYNKESVGAVLFDELYARLLKEIYGKLLGEAWDFIQDKSPITTYFHYFDAPIFNYSKEDSFLWRGETREAVFSRVIEEMLKEKRVKKTPLLSYGQVHNITFTNSFFGEVLHPALASALGFNVGPVPLEGNQATVNCGILFRKKDTNKWITFAPSWRFITDIGEDITHSIIPGGPSGRRFSGHYGTELKKYLNFEYKTLTLN